MPEGVQERQAAPARTGYRVDDLARLVASPVSRRKALKLGAGAFAGVAIGSLLPRTGSLLPRTAFAQGGVITCSPDTQYCFAYTCPSGTTCCPVPDNHLHKHYCPSGPCCDPCNPSSSKCQNGQCVKGPVDAKSCCEKSGGVVCGKDCCRLGRGEAHCCNPIFSFKAAHCCSYTQKHKSDCADGKYFYGGLAIAAGVGAALSAAVPPVAVAFALEAAAAGAANIAFDVCDHDPPDPDFRGLFVPTIPRVRVRAGRELTHGAARGFNKMINNTLRYSAYTFAWIRSIEKAQGAQQAGDTEWVHRHRQAAANYAEKAADALSKDLKLHRAARRQLERSGFRHFKLTEEQVRHWQHHVRKHGLSPQVKDLIREAHFDEGSMQRLRHDLGHFDPKAVADVGIFGEVDDGRFQRANNNMVRTLRQSAQSLASGGPLAP